MGYCCGRGVTATNKRVSFRLQKVAGESKLGPYGGYVQNFDEPTMHRNRLSSVRLGWASEKSECFNILQESAMIAIIDYGMGNLRSVSKAFEAVGHQAVVTRDSHVIGDRKSVV